jgi:hypothetical protein
MLSVASRAQSDLQPLADADATTQLTRLLIKTLESTYSKLQTMHRDFAQPVRGPLTTTDTEFTRDFSRACSALL